MPKDFPQQLSALIAAKLDGETGIYSLAVKDLSSGRQWLFNVEPMRSASLIKVFIMIEAFRLSLQGLLDLAENRIISGAEKTGGAGSLMHAPAGTAKTWRELITLMIVESDNTATNILIDRLSMPAVNKTIRNLGFADTILRRKMMDFAAARSGQENYTSASDMIGVLELLYRHRCLGPSLDNAMLEILKKQQDRSMLPALLPPGTIIANKTGELDGLWHDAGIIYTSHRDYAAAIMTDALADADRGQKVIAEISCLIYGLLTELD